MIYDGFIFHTFHCSSKQKDAKILHGLHNVVLKFNKGHHSKTMRALAWDALSSCTLGHEADTAVVANENATWLSKFAEVAASPVASHLAFSSCCVNVSAQILE